MEFLPSLVFTVAFALNVYAALLRWSYILFAHKPENIEGESESDDASDDASDNTSDNTSDDTSDTQTETEMPEENPASTLAEPVSALTFTLMPTIAALRTGRPAQSAERAGNDDPSHGNPTPTPDAPSASGASDIAAGQRPNTDADADADAFGGAATIPSASQWAIW
jgi:cytoskeletal protein RodZ